MKKIILLLVLVFCCSCEANYNVLITKDGIKDEFSTSIDTFNEEIKQDFKYKIYLSIGDDMFRNTSNYYFNETNDSFNYNNNYSFDQYKDSIVLNECFENVNYNNEKGVINIELDSFLCFDEYAHLDTVNIFINTDLEVFDSNYDEKNNNNYIWSINRNNYSGKKIIVNVRYSNSIVDMDKKSFDNYIDNVIYIFILIGLIIMLIIYVKYRKTNN